MQGTAYTVRAWTFSASAQLSTAAIILYLQRNNGQFCHEVLLSPNDKLSRVVASYPVIA